MSICAFGINTNGKEKKGRQQVGPGGIEKLSSGAKMMKLSFGAKDRAFMLLSSLALDVGYPDVGYMVLGELVL